MNSKNSRGISEAIVTNGNDIAIRYKCSIIKNLARISIGNYNVGINDTVLDLLNGKTFVSVEVVAVNYKVYIFLNLNLISSSGLSGNGNAVVFKVLRVLIVLSNKATEGETCIVNVYNETANGKVDAEKD